MERRIEETGLRSWREERGKKKRKKAGMKLRAHPLSRFGGRLLPPPHSALCETAFGLLAAGPTPNLLFGAFARARRSTSRLAVPLFSLLKAIHAHILDMRSLFYPKKDEKKPWGKRRPSAFLPDHAIIGQHGPRRLRGVVLHSLQGEKRDFE